MVDECRTGSPTSATPSMSRRSAPSTFPKIRMPSHSSGERTKSSLPFDGVKGHARTIGSSPGRSRIQSRESGPGKNREARRTVPAGRPTNPTRRTRPENLQPAWMWAAWTMWYFSRGAGAKRAAILQALSDCYQRRWLPPHDHPQQTAGKHGSALYRQECERWSTTTAHRLGDGSEDHYPPTSYRPG